MGKISQFRLLFRGAIYNELHEYEVCCDLFAVVLISLSFTVKRSKFSLATSSASSLSKSSINVEANKNSRHELQPTPVGSFLSGLWSSLVQSSPSDANNLNRFTAMHSANLQLLVLCQPVRHRSESFAVMGSAHRSTLKRSSDNACNTCYIKICTYRYVFNFTSVFIAKDSR